VLVRYADDFVVMCHTRHQAEQVWHRLGEWLAPRGLAFNEDKTHIVHVEQGFDFLGFNIRRYRGKLLIKPSSAAVKRIRQRLAGEVRSLRGTNAEAVIRRLNPIIRGWAAYYRSVVSKQVFSTVDNHVWQHTYRWALCAHPNKSRHWVVDKYFGAFNPSRTDRWIFGDRGSGIYLRRFAWTQIVRHRLVGIGAAGAAACAASVLSPSLPMSFISLLKMRRERPMDREASGSRLAPNNTTSTRTTISQ